MIPSATSRLLLPLASTARVVPHAPTRIRSTPKYGPLTLERLTLSGAGTPGGACDWVVNDCEVDGVSQLAVKDLPGVLFGSRGIVAEHKRATSTILFSGLDVIESASEVTVTVTYVGPNPEGAAFFGSIVGSPPPQRPTVLPIATRGPIRGRTTIRARLDAPLRIDAIEIDDRYDGSDWRVHDIRVDGATQFKQTGVIPGDLFSTTVIASYVRFRFDAGQLLEIDVEHVGDEPAGLPFVGRVLGTVVRDDYDEPPPDVRAIVRTSDAEDLGEEVVARCDWRPSHVPPIAS